MQVAETPSVYQRAALAGVSESGDLLNDGKRDQAGLMCLSQYKRCFTMWWSVCSGMRGPLHIPLRLTAGGRRLPPLLWSCKSHPTSLSPTHHCNRRHREPTGLAQTCATETSRQTPELFPTHKAGGPRAPQGQPGPAAGLRPAGDATGVTSTARGGHQLGRAPALTRSEDTHRGKLSARPWLRFTPFVLSPAARPGPCEASFCPAAPPPPRPPRPASGPAWKWGRGEGRR